jgi:hypothetical protein
MQTSLPRSEIDNLPIHELELMIKDVQEFKKAEARSLLGEESDGTS